MILDERNEFADNVDATGEAGTVNLGDVIDLGANQASVQRDIGNGHPLYWVISVDTAADGGAGAAATVQFHLVSDAVSTPDLATRTVHMSSPVYTALNDLTGETILVFAVPQANPNAPYERYLGVQRTVAVEGEDALFVSTYLTLDPHGNRAYPDAIN